MYTQLQVLAKVLVELGVVILVLSNLSKQLETLLDNVLADDLQTKAANQKQHSMGTTNPVLSKTTYGQRVKQAWIWAC